MADMKRLLEKAFFGTDVTNATAAIEQARQRFSEIFHRAGFSFELLAPATLEDEWVRERMIRPLLYHCQSTGQDVPGCPGVFVSLFAGARLYCIAGSDVFAWAAQELRESPDDWIARYGTHERETTLR